MKPKLWESQRKNQTIPQTPSKLDDDQGERDKGKKNRKNDEAGQEETQSGETWPEQPQGLVRPASNS